MVISQSWKWIWPWLVGATRFVLATASAIVSTPSVSPFCVDEPLHPLDRSILSRKPSSSKALRSVSVSSMVPGSRGRQAGAGFRTGRCHADWKLGIVSSTAGPYVSALAGRTCPKWSVCIVSFRILLVWYVKKATHSQRTSILITKSHIFFSQSALSVRQSRRHSTLSIGRVCRMICNPPFTHPSWTGGNLVQHEDLSFCNLCVDPGDNHENNPNWENHGT